MVHDFSTPHLIVFRFQHPSFRYLDLALLWPTLRPVLLPPFDSASERPTTEQNEARSNAFPNTPFLHKHITNTTTTLTTQQHHPRASSSSRHEANFLYYDDGRYWDESCDARSECPRTSCGLGLGHGETPRGFLFLSSLFFCFFWSTSPLWNGLSLTRSL